MKLNKKILIEIEVDDEDNRLCGYDCVYFSDPPGQCIFYGQYLNLLNDNKYLRCKKCAEQFNIALVKNEN